MEQNKVLEKVHGLELMIATEVKRICEKNDIKYFLTAGTALGAVRHGGFIPWDDDMDIGMLRSDYNRFIDACKTDLKEEFYLQTWDTDPQYPFSYAKVRLNGTHFVEGFSEKAEMNNGLFIDIFPFDNVPDNPKDRKKQALIYFICKRMLWIKKGMGHSIKNSKTGVLKYYAFLVFSAPFSYKSVKKYYSKVLQKYNNQKTDKIVTDGSYSYNKESIPRKWAENLAPINFETETFSTYKNVKEYLEYFYGDYMKLPPIEKRNGHAMLNVDFGIYGDL